MNQRAAASVDALTKALPFGVGDDLLLLSIFGSQVTGCERPDSDLDILYVTTASGASDYDAIRDAATLPGGVTNVTIIPHGPDTISRTANVYGSVEYGVLREEGARTLYRSADFDIKLHPEIDYDYSAGRWLDIAGRYVFPEGGYSEEQPGHVCFMMGMAMGILLRANLMSARVKFPFTRDIHALYGMLPRERRPPLDVDAAAYILERYGDSDEGGSVVDARAAERIAKPLYEFTREVITPVKAA